MKIIIILMLFNCLTITTSLCQNKEQMLELKDFLPIVSSSNIFQISENLGLSSKIEQLGWDMADVSFYEELLPEIENEKLDYRYFLLIAKLARSGDYKSAFANRIYYYYRIKFATLAIQNGLNLPKEISDSLKIQLIDLYHSASIAPNIWESELEFLLFSKLILKYIDSLKFSVKINKKTASLLYQTKADIIYEVYVLTEKDDNYISEVLLNYQMAINEDTNNYKAYYSRGKFYYYRLKNFKGALTDYKQSLLLEKRKKNPIAPNITDLSFMIGECYLKLNNYDEAINFLSNTVSDFLRKINNPETDRIDKEIYTKNVGKFYYSLSQCYYYKKEIDKACIYLNESLRFGYVLENFDEISSLYKCN